jgi:hypothetical protein
MALVCHGASCWHVGREDWRCTKPLGVR